MKDKRVLSFPKDGDFYESAAYAKMDEGDLVGALSLFRYLLSLKPNNAMIHVQMADVYTAMELYEEAIACLYLAEGGRSVGARKEARVRLVENLMYSERMEGANYYLTHMDAEKEPPQYSEDFMAFMEGQANRFNPYRTVYPYELADYSHILENARHLATLNFRSEADKNLASIPFGAKEYPTALAKRSLLRTQGDDENLWYETEQAEVFNASDIQSPNERPMNGSWDKLTLQIALVLVVYLAAYGVMALIGSFVGENLRSTIFGLNFLFGVLFAVVAKEILKLLNKKNVLKKQYTNNFLLTRISNFCFDTMIVCGIAVIRIDYIAQYWGIILILSAVGLICTYLYNHFVAKKLFPTYSEEQFLVMYGMLTGTASTGVILLREIDGDFQTPASENLVYQNFPAIAFGFPMMIIASIAPENPLLTLGIIALYLVVINVLLFRKQIFKKKSNATTAE